MRCLRCLSLLAIISVLSIALPASAQSAAIAPRIAGPVDESSLVTLTGNVPPGARSEFDKGEAPPATVLTQMRLVLKRSAEQQAALDKYDEELQEKSSPNYHKWLTPEQYGKLYGPADSDVAALVAWLESHGFSVSPIAPGRTSIAFAGTVRQAEEAFHTSIHSYEVNGEAFLSNNSDPKIPAALSAVVSGVASLNTLKPRPHHVVAKPGMFDPDLKRLTPAPSGTGSTGMRPELTGGSGTSSSPYVLYVTASDAATIYNTPNDPLNVNCTTPASCNFTGNGVTIGIGGDATINASTVVNYRNKFIGDSKQPTITYCTSPTSGAATCSSSSTGTGITTADQDEAYLDNEVSGGLAPGASLHFYSSSGLDTAIEQMLTDNTVDIFSLSFGFCELALGTAGNQLINGWWQQAETQGIAVVVSSGDSGSAGCDNQNTATVATQGLAVSGWSTTPYNVAVGGTDFVGLFPSGSTYTTTNFLQYVSATNLNTYYGTAKGPIPESTWNDSQSTTTTIKKSVPYVDPTTNKTNIVAGSGGVSNCSTNNGTTCANGYSKPSWQRGTGVPSDSARDVPDVSLMAGAGGDFAAWGICTDDMVQNTTFISNCSTQSDGNWYLSGIGGTSAAAPAFAGILALVQQKTGGRLGLAAKELYDLYNGSHASAIFHDVTQGNNSVPCQASSPNCQAFTGSGTSYNWLSGYDTTTGYDQATGLGSVDATQLISFWGTATGSSTPTVTLTPSATSITTAQSLTFAVAVTGSSGTPTGTVSLSGGGYTAAAQTLTSGAYTFNIAAGALARGSDTLTVTYSGDATYASATGTTTVTVTGIGSFTLSATNVSLTAGASTGNTSTVTVTPSGGYTGTVALTAAVTASPTGAVSIPTFTGSSVTISSPSNAMGTITVATTPVPTLVHAAARNRSGWFKAAGSAAIAALLFFFLPLGSRRGRNLFAALLLVVALGFTAAGCGGGGGGGGGSQKTTPSVTVSPAKTSIANTDTLAVAVTVSGGTNTATGTVTLTSGTYSSGAVTLASGAANITIPANMLAIGASDTLTATYSGDTNFNPATGTANVKVSAPGTTTGNYTVTVTGTDGATTATTTFTLTVN